MHRSGTSALAGTLQRLEVPLGAHLVAPWRDNPGGYFEHAGAVTVHESLLAALGRGWESLEPLADDWLQSPAALRAADALEALIREDFGAVPLWALKDPRLSRLLPLWHAVLAKLEIRPAHVFMLRHPDEVAGSLRHRDGMGEGYAHLLWLQHYLDAERDTRGHDRMLLAYDRLLEAPAASLQALARDLRIRWPCAPVDAALQAILDPAQRHHVAGIDAVGRGPGAAARELFKEAQAVAANGGAWPRGERQRELLSRWTKRLVPWIGGLGTALARQREAGQRALQQCRESDIALGQAQALSLGRLADLQARDARIVRSEDISLARLRELETLGTRLAQTDEALQATEAQSLDRLSELTKLGDRLALTDAALQSTEAQSLTRLRELEALGARLAKTDAALQSAEAQSMTRMRELETLGARLAKTDAALQSAEAQSLTRMRELETLGARLAKTDAALQATEVQSLTRLRELESMGARLAMTDAALQSTEAQSLTRLRELENLGARLEQTDAALQSTEAQSLTRLRELESMGARLAETDAALGKAQVLALDRLQQIASLELRLVATDEALDQAQGLAHGHLRELQAVQGQLASVQEEMTRAAQSASELTTRLHLSESRLHALRASLPWRLSRPLRWLGRRTGQRGPGWDAT